MVSFKGTTEITNMKITRRTINALLNHVKELYNGNNLIVDYIYMENDHRMIVLAKNKKCERCHEMISFNRINGKWDWGCRSSGFTSTYHDSKLCENNGYIKIYDRIEDQFTRI